MKIEEMTREERSLLLFLESCATDFGGKVDVRRMNDDDSKILKEWVNSKFIQYGRISMVCIEKSNDKKSCWVNLSNEAWELVHQERRARFVRIDANRSWKKSFEARMPEGINKEPTINQEQ